jgi:hypothetical protein
VSVRVIVFGGGTAGGRLEMLDANQIDPPVSGSYAADKYRDGRNERQRINSC